jgi:diacylglycerol kinase family enzyme
MKIALFHNPKAGNATLNADQLVRQFEKAGYEVFYASVEEEDWEKAASEPVDRVVIAGGDGTVSRVAPWLAGRKIPFCILPLGTANNCARSLGQMHTIESVIAGLRSERIKQLDVGIVTSSSGHRIFIEALGIGLLAEFMGEMRLLGKKKKSRSRQSPEERLADALRHLRLMAKDYPEINCELQLDDKIVAGRLLLLEVANMPFIGPNLQLAPDADPGDGWFDVTWIEGVQRKELRDYLELYERDERGVAPAETRRCQRVLFRYVDAPAHVDGRVFFTMAAPVSVRLQAGALDLLDLAVGP